SVTRKAGNPCWCATCRKTYPDLLAVRACPCGAPIPALRGEYVLTLPQLEREAKPKPCSSCDELVVWVLNTQTQGRLPLARSRARLVDFSTTAEHAANCPACRGHRRHYLIPTHFLDCP